jgi:hypothetical protein
MAMLPVGGMASCDDGSERVPCDGRKRRDAAFIPGNQAQRRQTVDRPFDKLGELALEYDDFLRVYLHRRWFRQSRAMRSSRPPPTPFTRRRYALLIWPHTQRSIGNVCS